MIIGFVRTVNEEMRMIDREKVIEGLEMSYRYSNVDEDNTLVPQQLVLDALVLLKEQVPRLMTLKEVKQWCETHPHKQNPIWVEFQPRRGTDGWRVCLFDSEILIWCKNNEARCWTSQPSDEQREAILWNAQK